MDIVNGPLSDMASMLKDRSRFFRRSVPAGVNVNNAANVLNDHRLPAISHVDTTSLIGLFDKYNQFDSAEDARNFAWPVQSNRRASKMQDIDQAEMCRNDSTGSSSLALSQKTDASPPITRHSSSSSLDPAVSPLLFEKTAPKGQSAASLPMARPCRPTSPAPFRKAKRASTWDPLTSQTAGVANLDKPLPAGPPSRRVEGYETRPAPAHEPRDRAPAFRYNSLNQHQRSLSAGLPPAVVPRTPQDPATHPKGTSRGARLGIAITNNSPPRSKSDTLTDGDDSNPRKRSPQASTNPRSKANRAHKSVTSRTAEQVIYRIMCHLGDLQDLQSAAMVSKGFLNTYQRNESKLVSHVVFKSSRPAWELRRTLLTLRGTRCFRLRDYQQDLQTVRALKRLIATRCSNNCKAKTLAGLMGQDAQCEIEVENALWRIWTFCALFGSDAALSPVPPPQLAWLNGHKEAENKSLGAEFAIGNHEGLTVDELEDMSEMWQCLHTLLSQFYARLDEAKQVGIFSNEHLSSSKSDHQHVAEWVAYLLTLGPKVVLSLSSGSFDKARMLGLTDWTPPVPGQSRLRFVTSAISHVYQERILAEATAKASEITLPPYARHRPSRSTDYPASKPVSMPHKSLRVDTAVINCRAVPTCAPRTAPADLRPDCDPVRPPLVSNSSMFPASPTNDPSLYHTLSMTAAASTKIGATLFPVEYATASPRVPFKQEERAFITKSEIIDPIDKALQLLTTELGFAERNAKRALAMSDSGSGIDVEKAIHLLVIESTKSATMPIELPTPDDIVSPLRAPAKRKEYCDKLCKRDSSTRATNSMLLQTRASSHHAHTRSWSTGAVEHIQPDPEPSSPNTDIYGDHSSSDRSLDAGMSAEWQREAARGDVVSPLVTTSRSSRNLSRMSTMSRNSKAWKVLGMPDPSIGMENEKQNKGLVGMARARTRRASGGVVGMDEYNRRVERRRSLRQLQAEKVEERKQKEMEAIVAKGQVSEGLGQQFKGLGLGGLGGFRVVERQVSEEKRWKAKGRRSAGEGGLGGCMPVTSP